MNMRILILEAAESDETILEDVFVLLSDRMSIQVVDLSHDTKKCNSPEPQVLTFSDLEIHVREQAVYKAGVLIPMSHYEFFTLCYLAKHPGWVFSKQQIYEAVWQERYAVEDKTITVHISNIRAKLRPSGTDSYIQTVWGIGFKLAGT